VAVSPNVHHVADLSTGTGLISPALSAVLSDASEAISTRGVRSPKKLKLRSEKPLLSEFSARPGSPPDASSRLPEHHRIGYTNGNALAIRPQRHGAERAESEFENGAGDRIRTCDPRFKSSSRAPRSASSRLLPNSILRFSPPHGSPSLPSLAIQIGYTKPSPKDRCAAPECVLTLRLQAGERVSCRAS